MVDSEQEVENTKELQLKKTIFNELTKLRRKKKRGVLREADYKAIIKIDKIKKKAIGYTWKKIQKLDIQNEADKFENYTLEFIKKMLDEKDSEKCFGTTINKIAGISTPHKLSIKTQRTSIDPDCVAMYQDTIFVIECKYTENESGKYGSGITKDIHTHHDRIKQFQHVLNDDKLREVNKFDEKGWEKGSEVKGVFALRNVKLTNEERCKMKDKKFAIWDDDFLEYYKNLQNLIGTYAIFDMLGEMGIKNYDDDPVMSYALKTETKFEKTRKKLSVYQFLLDPKKLLKVATVARRDRPEKDFYQRQLIPKKLKALAKFHQSGGISPNNIVIGFPPNASERPQFNEIKPSNLKNKGKHLEAYLKNMKDDIKSSGGKITDIKMGILVFPQQYRTCWVIDGQHRLYSMALEGFEKTFVQLPIIGYEDIEIKQMAKVFLNINTKQKPIDSSLKFDLKAEYEPHSSEGLQARIVKQLNEKIGPLTNLFYYPSLKDAKIEKKKRVGIQIMAASINVGRLEKQTLKFGRDNPLHKLSPPSFDEENPNDAIVKYHNGLVNRVVKIINKFYIELNKIYGEKDVQTYIYGKQTSKVLIPVLAQIILHVGGDPTPAQIRKYCRGMGTFMEQMHNPDRRKALMKKSSNFGNAEDVQKEICQTIAGAGVIAKSDEFGKDLIDSTIAEWTRLHEMIGICFNDIFVEDDKNGKPVNKWEPLLTPSQRTALKQKRWKEGVPEGEEFTLLDMTMIKRILVPDNRTTAEFRKFCTHLQETIIGRDSGEEEFEATIMDAISKLEEQWMFDSQDDPSYPDAQRNLNVGHVKNLMNALIERYPDDEEEEEEE